MCVRVFVCVRAFCALKMLCIVIFRGVQITLHREDGMCSWIKQLLVGLEIAVIHISRNLKNPNYCLILKNVLLLKRLASLLGT